MRILVTGGAGFIGTTLCRRLLGLDHQVVCLDNFYTGRKQNIRQLLDNKNFELLEHDVVKPFDVDCDQVYHLACPASPPKYQRDPVYTSQICFNGTLNAIRCALNSNARFLLASTSEVYGDPEQHPQHESYRGSVNCNGVRSCYDVGKRIAESITCDFYRSKDLDYRIERIFNTYGMYMDPNDGRVVSNFICQALRGEDLTIYGDGSQTRSLCYVDDLVDGLISHMGGDYMGVCNLGNPEEITVKQLADIVIQEINPNLRSVYRTLPSDDPTRRCPDISIAKDALGWEPKVKLKEGLNKTIGYFKNQLSL